MSKLDRLDENLAYKIVKLCFGASFASFAVYFLLALTSHTRVSLVQVILMLIWLVLSVGLINLIIRIPALKDYNKYFINIIQIAMVVAVAITMKNPETFAIFYVIMILNFSFRDRVLHYISALVQLVTFITITCFFPILLPADNIQDSSLSLMVVKITIFVIVVFTVDGMIKYNKKITAELINQEKEITTRAISESVGALIHALEAKDRYTNGHSQRVSRYAMILVKKISIGINSEIFITGSLLHDIGKIGMPDSLLENEEILSDDEFIVIREHPLIGARILEDTFSLKEAIPMVLHHHERFDGKGYPYGLLGEEIPIEARILAVADAFDAMTSDRPYRTALTLKEAYKEIVTNAGRQFCPKVTEAFIEAFGEIENAYNQGKKSKPQINSKECQA